MYPSADISEEILSEILNAGLRIRGHIDVPHFDLKDIEEQPTETLLQLLATIDEYVKGTAEPECSVRSLKEMAEYSIRKKSDPAVRPGKLAELVLETRSFPEEIGIVPVYTIGSRYQKGFCFAPRYSLNTLTREKKYID